MSEIRVDRFKAEDGISAPQFPNGINVTGVVTATVLNGTVPYLTVGSNAQAGAAGIVTAKGANINGDLDVDGHTNLDNVNISGVTSVASLTQNRVTYGGSNGKLQDSGNLTFDGSTLAVTGDASISGKLSVGSTLTYEDVTNIDSVGIITARLGVRVPDNVYSYFGTGNDLSIRHDASGGNHSYIFNSGAGVFKLGSNTQFIIGKTSNATYIQANPDGDVKLYFNNNQKLATSNTGVTVTGTLAATAVTGDGSALTGIVAIPTGAIMAWPTESIPSGVLKSQGQAISRSTYSSLFTALGVTYGAGDGSSTFNLPDYRGEFLRGRAEGSTNDPDRASRTDRGDGNGGDNVGSKQDYAVVEHSHGNNSGGGQNHGYNSNSNNTGTFSKSGHGYSSNQAHSYGIVHSQSYGSNYANVNGHVTNNEVRPRNVYVHWIIKT